MYDRMTRAGERAALARLRRELLGSLHGDVLEIGAGTGANFAHYPAGVRVTALEPDPHMLKRAREKLRPAIQLRQAAGESLPFDDDSFDAVVSTLVLCTVKDVRRTLGEVRRVLRPDGRLVFIEHVRAEGFAGTIQDVIRPAWRYFGGGCNVNRHTARALQSASFDLASMQRTKFAPIMPIIYGSAAVS